MLKGRTQKKKTAPAGAASPTAAPKTSVAKQPASRGSRGRYCMLTLVAVFLAAVFATFYLEIEIFSTEEDGIQQAAAAAVKPFTRDAGASSAARPKPEGKDSGGIYPPGQMDPFVEAARKKAEADAAARRKKDEEEARRKKEAEASQGDGGGANTSPREHITFHKPYRIGKKPDAERVWIPKPLKCTEDDVPDGWPTPDKPVMLDQLRNFCDDMKICKVPPYTRTIEKKAAILDQVRLPKIRAELEKLDPPGGTVIVTLLNYGYAFLWVNFVCGCEKRGIQIRNSMLIVATDKRGYELAKKMGFATISTDYVTEKFHIDDMPPPNFSKGDYYWLAGMMNVFLADVHAMGYHVLIQDADITWRHDPRPYLHREEAKEFDVQAMGDGAPSSCGFKCRDKRYNGGFIWYRNNCNSRAFLASLQNIVEWILYVRTDQRVINRLLQDPHFEGIKVHVLEREKFLNGNRWDPWQIKPGRPLPIDGMVWHASWTHNHFLKMTKLLVIGEWHISSCRWYDPDLVPVFNFTKELGDYGKDEFGHTERIIKEMIKPHWRPLSNTPG